MTTLIIAEKPSVARDIALVIGATMKKQGYLEGAGYKVTWCFGHLVELANPSVYDPSWERWDLSTLPMLPGSFELTIREDAKEQFETIKRLLHDPATHTVVNACDAGREGELIFRYVYEKAGATTPIKRLWIASLTEEAIRDGMANLMPGRDFDNLCQAARARSEADWLVGLNATRAITLTVREAMRGVKVPTLSVGRVQTPTLAMVVNRQREIRAFTPTDYFTICGEFALSGKKEDLKASMVQATGERETVRYHTREEAEVIRQALSATGAPATLTQLGVTGGVKNPPPLFDLTLLQRVANNRLGFSAQQTLDIAQRLYETHKVLTYPRTDSRFITPDMVEGLSARVDAVKAYDRTGALATGFVVPDKPGARVVNAAKVTDHHAILPTEVTPRNLSEQEEAIYVLVATRMLAALSPPAKTATTSAWVELEGKVFYARGVEILEKGWLAIEEEKARANEEQNGVLPQGLREGMAFEDARVSLLEGKTRAPSRLSEASLLGAMESAGTYVDEEELAAALGERGLGTPATRAQVIEKLIGRGYIERQGKFIDATELGESLIEALSSFENLISPQLTAKWEKAIANIEEGTVSRPEFITQVEVLTKAFTAHFIKSPPTLAIAMPEPVAACPLCQRAVHMNERGVFCEQARAGGCSLIFARAVAGKTLSENQVKKLLTKGTTGELKGFVSKAGKKFSAALVLKTHEDGNTRPAFDFGREEEVAVGSCPTCSAEVRMDGRVVRCTACEFGFWRTVAKKQLTQDDVKLLLTMGRTAYTEGFVSKAGKKFGASLVLDVGGEKARLDFDFERPTVSIGPCPACSGEMHHDGKVLTCNACGVKFWGNIARKTLTETQLKTLLVDKKLPKTGGFTNRKGEKFEAALVLEEDSTRGWRISFDF